MVFELVFTFGFFIFFVLTYRLAHEYKIQKKVNSILGIDFKKKLMLKKISVKELEEGLFQGLEQLPRLLGAGLPLFEALEILSQEKNVFAKELKKILKDIALGEDLAITFEKSLKTCHSESYAYFLTILQLQTEMGGSLKEVLENLYLMLRSKKRLFEKAKALSSESRFSIVIIGSLPFLICILLIVFAPSYMMHFFTHSSFFSILSLALFFWCMGIFWMIRLTRLNHV